MKSVRVTFDGEGPFNLEIVLPAGHSANADKKIDGASGCSSEAEGTTAVERAEVHPKLAACIFKLAICEGAAEETAAVDQNGLINVPLVMNLPESGYLHIHIS